MTENIKQKTNPLGRLMFLMLSIVLMIGSLLFTQPVFAAAPSISYDFTNGVLLDSVAKVDPTTIDNLVNVMPGAKTVPAKNGWNAGYRRSGNATNGYTFSETNYLMAPVGTKTYDNVYIVYRSNGYDMKVTIDQTYNATGGETSVTMPDSAPQINGCVGVYSAPNNNSTVYPNLGSGSSKVGKNLLVQFHVDIFKAGTGNTVGTERIDLPRLYDVTTDIDAAQAFKVINEPLTADNMLIKAKGIFKHAGTGFDAYYDNATQDVYVKTGDGVSSDIQTGEANLYQRTAKLKTEGLDKVFGFNHGAASSILVYSEKYTASYKATPGGTVSKASEKVWAELNPLANSTPTADTGYRFTGWTTDQAVTIDGKTFAKGDAITMADVKKLVMTSDVSFTANFEKIPQVKIVKSSEKQYVQPGDTFTYSLTATNTVAGSCDKNVKITDEVPDDLKVVEVTNQYGTAVDRGGNVEFTFDSLSDTETKIVYVTVEVLKDNDGAIDNTATITGDYSPNPDSSTYTVNVVVPELKITKETDKKIYHKDDEISYTITVENTKEHSTDTNVVITDKDISKGVNINMDTIKTSSGTVTKGDNTFTVKADKLTYGTPIVITFKGTIDNDKVESKDLNNTATAKGDYSSEVKDDSPITLTYNVITSVINGTITDDQKDIPRGEDRTISYKPNDGYYLKSVAVDNSPVDTKKYPESYTFADIKADYQIDVVYAKIPKLNITKTPEKTSYSTDDVVKYEVRVKQGIQDAVASNVVIEDSFAEKGIVKVNKISAITMNGADITETCDIDLTENGYKIATHKDMGDSDELVITYEGIALNASEKLVNTVIASCDEADATGDSSINAKAEADIAIKAPELKIEKSSDKTSYNVGDIGKYTLVGTITNEVVAKDVQISDKFDKDLGVINKDSIKVNYTNAEGISTDITADCTINAKATEFSIDTGKDLVKGENITVTYQVKFTKSVKKLKNVAVMTSSNARADADGNIGVKAENNVTVIAPELAIVKESNKQEYKLNDTGKYTLTGTVKNEAVAKNVSISDTIDKGKATLIANSIKVVMNGSNITKDCNIETSENGFVVHTNRDMTKMDKLVVTYKVKFVKASDKTINTATMTADNAIAEDGSHISVTTTNTVSVIKPETTKKPLAKIVKTGDDAKAFAFAFAGGIAAIALLAVVVARRKKA